MSTPSTKPATILIRGQQFWHRVLITCANLLCGLWIALCLAYISQSVGLKGVIHLNPLQLGVTLLGLASVPGMIWIALAHFAGLSTMERANRSMARHFRDFTRFSVGERREIAETSEAARRESLSLFEAAQASLAALGQIESSLKQNTIMLIGAATESTGQVDAAGKKMEERADAVRQLTGQFTDSSAQLQKRAAEAVTAMEAVLTRLETSQRSLGENTTQLDAAADRTVSRLHLSGEAIQITVSSLGDATSLLDARRDQIQRMTDDVTVKLQKAADRIGDELQSIEGAAANSADVLTSAARQAADTLAENAAILDDHAQDLEQAGSKLATNARSLVQTGRTHIDALQAAAASVVENADKVSQTFSGTIGTIATLSNDVVQRVEQAAGHIHAGLDGIRDNIAQTSTVVDRFAEMGDRMQRYRCETEESLTAILQRLDHLASRFQGEVGNAHEVERAIGQVAGSVIDALDRIRSEQHATTREIDSFSERSHGLSMRLEGLRVAAIGGVADMVAESDRLQQRSESLTDELKGQAAAFGDAMNRADGVASVVKSTAAMIDQTIAAAGEASRSMRHEFQAATHDMQSSTGAMQHEAAQAVETLAQAKSRMEDSLAQIGAILSNLDGKAADINVTVSSSISRLNEMTHGLERARAEVLGSSDRAAEHIDNATQSLYASADHIRAVADHVSGATDHAVEMGNQLAGKGDALRDRVAEITQSVYEASDKLQATTNDLSSSATYTREQLGQIAREVRSENEAIANTLGRIAMVETALRNAGAMVDDIVANAEKAANSARDEMHSVGREIALQTKVLVETSGSNGIILGQARDEMETVVTRVQDAFGSLNQKASEINFTVSTAVNRLGELSRGLESAQANIDGAASGASDRMAQAASALRIEFGGVHEIADRALEQLDRTLAAIAATSANVDAEAQTIEHRLTASFKAAETGSLIFAEKAGFVVEQIERAEQSLAAGQARLSGVADDSAAHLQRLTQELARSGSELGNATMISSERIASAANVVDSRMQSINAIADQVRSALGNFASDLGSVSVQSDEVTQQLTQRGHVLRDNIVQIVRSAEDSAESLKATTAGLLNNAIEISDAAGRTRTEIIRATADLKREGNAIAETEAQSRALASQVAALLGERAMELAQTARKVAAETTTMREVNAKFQRDLFLSAANTVLHALTSLSVDISRVLDTDLPEELRLELVRGDIPTFVRRLASLRDTVSTPKLRAKFATDNRFRTHVQTYLSQFEELLTQASKVDQGAVLSATLVSSDIGKIYTFLSAAISTEYKDMQQTA